MKVIADTNLLLRAVLPDDGQRAAAIAELAGADVVAISIHALREPVRVLSRRYETSRTDLAATVRGLVAVENVAVDHAALAAGLAMLDAGGISPTASSRMTAAPSGAMSSWPSTAGP